MRQTIQAALKKQSESLRLPNVSKPGASSPASKSVLPQTPVECSWCADYKFIGYNVDPGHPYFGRITPCPKCNQVGVTLMSGLQPHERKILISDLDADKRAGAQTMIAAGHKFIENPTAHRHHHVIMGQIKRRRLRV